VLFESMVFMSLPMSELEILALSLEARFYGVHRAPVKQLGLTCESLALSAPGVEDRDAGRCDVSRVPLTNVRT